MRFRKSLLLHAIRPLIWSSGTLAATLPLLTRQHQNETGHGNETDSPQSSNSSRHGLGSDPIVQHGIPHVKGFFEPTDENVNASRFGEAYAEWIIGVDKDSLTWKRRKSEPDFFAKEVLDWPDEVICGIAYKGCHNKPSCEDISERIENRERARQICFIFDSFDQVSLISGVIYVRCSCSLRNIW